MGERGGEKGEGRRGRGRHNLPGPSHPSPLAASGASALITAGATHRAASSGQLQGASGRGEAGHDAGSVRTHCSSGPCRKPRMWQETCSEQACVPSLEWTPAFFKWVTVPQHRANPHRLLQQKLASLGVNLLLKCELSLESESWKALRRPAKRQKGTKNLPYGHCGPGKTAHGSRQQADE